MKSGDMIRSIREIAFAVRLNRMASPSTFGVDHGQATMAGLEDERDRIHLMETKLGVLLWSQYNLVGRVMTAAFRWMGLERTLQRLPQNLAALTNFGTRWMAAGCRSRRKPTCSALHRRP